MTLPLYLSTRICFSNPALSTHQALPLDSIEILTHQLTSFIELESRLAVRQQATTNQPPCNLRLLSN